MSFALTHPPEVLPEVGPFADWCRELDKEAEARGYGPFKEGSLTLSTGRESWRCYYDDKFSPEDALDEDEQYEW